MWSRVKQFFRSDRFKAYLEGYCSAFDIFPTIPPPKILTEEEAIRASWKAVSSDMQMVLDELERTTKAIKRKNFK